MFIKSTVGLATITQFRFITPTYAGLILLGGHSILLAICCLKLMLETVRFLQPHGTFDERESYSLFAIAFAIFVRPLSIATPRTNKPTKIHNPVIYVSSL